MRLLIVVPVSFQVQFGLTPLSTDNYAAASRAEQPDTILILMFLFSEESLYYCTQRK